MRKVFLNYIPVIVKTSILYAMPYLYPVFEIMPSSCTIMLTNRCNLKCIMCKQWREEPRDELSSEEWKRIIDDLKRNGIKNIHFTGGEPLLRKDALRELVSYACRNDFAVGLTTNGLLLNAEFLQELVGVGLRSIAISIDALYEEYEEIRGLTGSFAKLEEAVHLIADVRKKNGIDAYINFTLMNNNIDEFEHVKRLGDEVNLPVAVCLLDKHSSIFDLEENRNKLWISGDRDFDRLKGLLDILKREKGMRPRSLLLNFPMIDFIRDYFRDPRQRWIPCVSSQDRIIIDPYGNMFGGCLSMGSFGNLKSVSFSKLTKDRRYNRAKQDMFYKRCAGCSCGYQFNIRHFLPLIMKDLIKRMKVFGGCQTICQTKF